MFQGILHGGSMFERRSRVMLGVLVLVTGGLLLRAAQLQITQASDWQTVAAEAMKRTSLTDTTRGSIVDRKGRVLAEDVACRDAAVDYRLIQMPPDEKLVERLARDIARKTPGYYEVATAEQVKRVEQSIPKALAEIDTFWATLARLGEVAPDEIEQTRLDVVAKVQARRRQVVMNRYRNAMDEHEQQDFSPWWRRWLLGEADAPPEMDEFEEPIADETQLHTVLHDISPQTYNALRKLEKELFPTLGLALEVRAAQTRFYPHENISAHVVGLLGKVSREDLRSDPNLEDERKRYFQTDYIGAFGLESLGEAKLRGMRGQTEFDLNTNERSVTALPETGQQVASTIDIALSRDIREAFNYVDFAWPRLDVRERLESRLETGFAPGAAVVIDIETGGLLAMVSAPDFDLNDYREEFQELGRDHINRPLLNRATRYATVPGSTVKPLVGVAAVTAGHMHAHGTIECTGYLTLPVHGKTIRYTSMFRCWTASMYGHIASLQGHQNGVDKHPTRGLNPSRPEPGQITLADALQRSCNVFFETLGHRMGAEELSSWLRKFGIGDPTGVGLSESRGLLPTNMPQSEVDRNAMRELTVAWEGAIGQGWVQATPMQMANVAATLARDGVYVQPTLLEDDISAMKGEAVDLELDEQALEMMRRGMNAVVHTPSGSGHHIDDRLPLRIAGKTGSAQAHQLNIPNYDAEGAPLLDHEGRQTFTRLQLSLRGEPNPQAPWYRRNNLPKEKLTKQTHAWFIGWAPQENPKYAFAVFVEYGGSGGYASGSVVAQVVQALVKHGYLEAEREPADDAPLDDSGFPTRYVTPAWDVGRGVN